MAESPNFSELRDKINNWDIDAEEMLLRKMKLFTENYLEQFNQFSKNMDSLDLHLVTAEVQNYKAFSQLKILSNHQFIEDILDKNEVIDEVIEEQNNTETAKDIVINDIETKKRAIDISLKNLEEIQSKKGKDKDKEQIEDDTVSVSSSKLNLDNFSKYIRMPFVIGTPEFEKDKTLGLTIDKGEENEEENKKEDNDSEDNDSDKNELLSDIVVDEKRKKKWQKVEEKRKKKKEKEKLKMSGKPLEANHEFEEDKVDVPKETENGFLVVENENMKEGNNNIENKGGFVPPPPPPPPAPQALTQNQNEIVQKEENIQNPNNNIEINNKENNNSQKNNIIIMPKFEKVDDGGLKVEGNNENKNPLTVESLKKKDIFGGGRIDNILADSFPDDDEDDDMDDGLFSRKNRKIPVIPTQIPIPNPKQNPIQNPIPSNNMYQSQMPQFVNPPLNQNPIQNNNVGQSQMIQMPQIVNPPIPQNNIQNNFISNSNLGLAKKKLSNMFGDESDEEEDIKPPMANTKKEENIIGNNLFKNEEKKFEIKEEKKEEEKKNKEEEKNNQIELNKNKKMNLIIGGDGGENEIKFVKKESSKDKMVNSLFSLPEEVEAKNSNEIKETEKANTFQDKKESQKKLAFLFDDDE